MARRAGSQTGTGNRWGEYSDMTVDPVDDCTFWYTNEYYQTNSSFNWRTGITSFKFAFLLSGYSDAQPDSDAHQHAHLYSDEYAHKHPCACRLADRPCNLAGYCPA